MAEVTYRSPGFFETEIDLSGQVVAGAPSTPAGLVGTSPMGPAFVPTTVSTLSEFVDKFGDDTNNRPAAYYAAQEYFKNGNALTFVRVLGAGANSTAADITNTRAKGTTIGAGFVISGTNASVGDGRGKGFVQFLLGKHDVQTGDIDAGYPIFSQASNTFTDVGSGNTANLVRGVLLLPTGTRAHVINYSQNYSLSNAADDSATPDSSGRFKIVISSSDAGYGTADGNTGVKVYTASYDPDSDNYIAKILNTSPQLFESQQHLLYLHYPVDTTVARLNTSADSVAIASGSTLTSTVSGDSALPFQTAFGKYDARYLPARTTPFISQPFGDKEYDLFSFETLGHGAYTSTKFKISITGLKKSDDPTNPYGTFNVQVRDYYDTDFNPVVLEQFIGCNLNPDSDAYIGNLIGDKSVYFNFDALTQNERRFISSGKYPNRSRYIRAVINESVEKKIVPATALPFGFNGLPLPKTNDTLKDLGTATAGRRMWLSATDRFLTGSVVAPVPMRFKVTTGETLTSPGFLGQQGVQEIVDGRLYWGIKFERVESALDPNSSSKRNEYIDSAVKFAGSTKLDVFVTGSGANNFSNNKFTLAKVALYNNLNGRTIGTAVSDLTGTLNQIMINAFYARGGTLDSTNYTVDTGALTDRLTFASLYSLTSSYYFNRFTDYMKYTNVMYGGWDGTNILDPDMAALNDKATSSESGGLATGSPNVGLSLTANAFGAGTSNSAVNSYRSAIDIITNPLASRVNTVTIPGIRDSSVTNYALTSVKDYARGFYIMDIPSYDDTGARIFSTTTPPDVSQTIRNFAARSIDNRYAATYFPDVSLLDATTGRRVRVPASVVALGAIAQNDNLAFPWYAPAGFNRASLADVVNLAVRVNSTDRDSLYDARINPITSFPGAGYVIFGQKTLQISNSALNRVNVMRMLIEVASRVSKVGLNFVFEQNTATTRARFVSQLTPELTLVQSQSGIDRFTITMNETNNTAADIEQNKLNGRIVMVPTKTVEFISIDFIITNSGVQFV
jgi:hypothetical protein